MLTTETPSHGEGLKKVAEERLTLASALETRNLKLPSVQVEIHLDVAHYCNRMPILLRRLE